MSDGTSPGNPYDAPSTEKFSPKLTPLERDVLLAFRAYREPIRFLPTMSNNVLTSLWLTPVAIGFGAVAGGAAYGLSGGEFPTALWIGVAAFAAALLGFLFRDLVDTNNTQQLAEATSRVTDFDEVDRLLYDRPAPPSPRTAPADEPLAAIPVDEFADPAEDRVR